MSSISSSVPVEEVQKGAISRIFKGHIFPILFEIILPLGLITALSFIFDEGHRFMTVSPHPFWMVLLLVVTQHGTQRGLICAVFCSLFLLVDNIPPQEMNEDLYDYFFKVMHRPLLWFIVAFVLGEMRVRHIQQTQEIMKQADEFSHQKSTLERAFQNQKKIKEALEVRIAAEFRAPATPLRCVTQMIQTSPDRVLDGFIKAIENLINPEKFSIYVLQGDVLQLLYQHNWGAEETFKTTHDSSSPLYDPIVNKKKPLCVIYQEEQKVLGKEGVLALPLYDPEDESVFAMIKFEDVSFRELNLSNIEAIKELCNCACKAYCLSLKTMVLGGGGAR